MKNTKSKLNTSRDCVCGATIVEPMCEIKPNTNNDGMGFYIKNKLIIKSLRAIPNDQIIIMREAIDGAYKMGYSNASVYFMNRR